MDFEVKNQKILEEIRFKNNVFFDCIFLWILGGFGEDFGMVLGGVWSLLVPLGALFGIIFWGLYPEGSPKGVLEGPRVDFDSILEGLGWVWGGFWEGFGRTWRVEIVVFLDRVF